jgi:hypothetical protein
MITDADVIRQLIEIKNLAMRDYPYPVEQEPLDGNLLLTLGQIAGMAGKAIAEFEK